MAAAPGSRVSVGKPGATSRGYCLGRRIIITRRLRVSRWGGRSPPPDAERRVSPQRRKLGPSGFGRRRWRPRANVSPTVSAEEEQPRCNEPIALEADPWPFAEFGGSSRPAWPA